MTLFNINDFSKGLNAEYNRLRVTPGEYPLLVNGRTRNGTVKPVKRHQQFEDLPAGIIQEVAVVGDLLVVFLSGRTYYKVLTDATGDWTPLSANPEFDTSVDEIYTTLLSVTANFFNRSGTPDTVAKTFNTRIASAPQALYASDTINQAKLIGATGAIVTAGTYSSWTQDNPNYIPLASIPCVSGQKLFLVSVDKKAILQSVSGRQTDFMINVAADGTRGGPASSMQIAVDFNDLTAVLPTAEGGLIASTLYATYMVFPDTNATLFGEYVYRSQLAFPVGCVNHKSTVDLVGDTAFISQSGIQSFNVTSQTKRESNNFPLGAKIARYLQNPQSDTAACNFDDYALFAMNTVFGRAVVVYDTIREQFVSIDTGFGQVKKFAVYRNNGVVRLFFSNTDNQLFEAYSGADYAVCRVLLGDYSAQDAGKQHAIDKCYLAFSNIAGTVPVEIKLYSDNRLVQATTSEVVSTAITPAAPTVIPFVPVGDTNVLDLQMGRKMFGYKTSVWLSWEGQAELVGVTLDGMAAEAQMPSIYTPAAPTVATKLVLVGNLPLGTVTSASGFTKVEGLTIGEHYAVTGNIHDGGQIRGDTVFVPTGTTVYLDGTLANCEDSWQLVEELFNETPDSLVTLGNVCQPTGSEADFARLELLLSPLDTELNGVTGASELATASGKAWFNRLNRYYHKVFGAVELFFLDTKGSDFVSRQVDWIRFKLRDSTARFKVIVMYDAPYTDCGTDYTTGQLDWATLGADLVIAGNTTGYERFYIGGFPYINVSATGGAIFTQERAIVQSSAAGYLRVAATEFELTIDFVGVDGTLLDSTTIYAR